jgi:imidazolonepropionase-like amidohydrolase
MTVEINEGRIISIRHSSEAFLTNNAVVMDATGKFLIPGLWDMHVHLLQEKRIKKSFPWLLANGVLGIRDMGGPSEELEKISEWRRQLETGELLGPRIIASGPMIDGATPMFPHLSIPATDEIEARQNVGFLKQSGMDFSPFELF